MAVGQDPMQSVSASDPTILNQFPVLSKPLLSGRRHPWWAGGKPTEGNGRGIRADSKHHDRVESTHGTKHGKPSVRVR